MLEIALREPARLWRRGIVAIAGAQRNITDNFVDNNIDKTAIKQIFALCNDIIADYINGFPEKQAFAAKKKNR